MIGLENSRHFLNQSDAILTKTNRDLVTPVFPRFRPVTCAYFEFSLAPCDTYLFSDWLLLLLRKVLYQHFSRATVRAKVETTTKESIFAKIGTSINSILNLCNYTNSLYCICIHATSGNENFISNLISASR